MATSPYHISSLLDKMSSVDKDFRFMATNDLMAELQRDSIKLDDDSERKVVQAVLRLVEDKNGEVQNLAVRCLGPLVCKIKDGQVEIIVNELCTNMFSDDERLRDISSVGLKTVISQLPNVSQNVSNSVCRNITNRLVNSIDKPSLNQYVLLEGLDILGDLIHRHGVVLISYHEQLLKSLMPLLVDPRPVSVRKRSYMALCYLSSCCSQELYDTMITQLIDQLNNNKTSSLTNIRTFVQCIGAISRQSGQRITSYLEVILPVLMTFVKSEDDELKESCLQAFEVLVCFREISPSLNEVINVCLNLLAHDPNYNYESDGEEEDEDAMETDDFDEEDDSYSDDDDISWKVRRAAAKTLAAIHTSRPDLIVDFYTLISPALIGRFKEREENVKCDIFLAYRALLGISKSYQSTTTEGGRGGVGGAQGMETSEANPLHLLQNQVPLIVKALHKQLKDKSIKTRQGCFSLLTDLVVVLPGAIENEVGLLTPGIVHCLNDTNASSNMRIDTLLFLNVLFANHSPSALHPYIPSLIPAVIRAVNDNFYKITSEALLVLQHIVKIIRPLDETSTFDYEPFAMDIYNCAMNRLTAADIDQEVKERAITAMGQIMANLGDTLQSKLSECLPVYVNRLHNEITRLTAVRAITVISRSPLKLDITLILSDTIPLLASFLRKNHRDLKLASLLCLIQLLTAYNVSIGLIKEVLEELPPLINDNDLHIAQHVLTLLCTIMTVSPISIAGIKSSILPNIMTLLLSSLLQGNALNTVANFFSQLVLLSQPGLKFQDIFEMLVSHVQAGSSCVLHKQAFQSLSRCIAVICMAVPSNIQPVVEKFMVDIQSVQSSEPSKHLALFSIGEIGKQSDLSNIGSLHVVIINLFGSASEEIRSAASYSLGCISSGNLSQFLPFILSEIHTNPKRQYLLLHSLKEIISNSGYDNLKPHVVQIWDVLFQHFQSSEEGTRNVVAECVGKLTLVDPQTLLPKLKENLSSDSAHVRGTVITAFKYTISDQPHPIDSQLQECIEEFMKAISDVDLNVRRVSLVAFNSAAHNKPSLVADLLESILPNLYNETKVKKELIRQVEMGPFKHTVDDGLDLRKAAFECMYTLLETCLTRIDVFEFLNHVEDGLRDHYDIKMLTFLLLVRLSYLRPIPVLQRLEKLLEPLRVTVQARVKANSVKQEFEKQEEMKRSAIRCVVALLAIPDAEKNPQLMEFVQQIKSNADTASLYESVKQDSTLAGTPTRIESMDFS